jgi:hypothetical protein
MPKFEYLITYDIFLVSTAQAVLKTEKRNCIGQKFIFSQFCAVVKNPKQYIFIRYSNFELQTLTFIMSQDEMPTTKVFYELSGRYFRPTKN